MPTALITGITGQDGSYLAELLLEKGYTVYGMARRETWFRQNNASHLRERIHILLGDMTEGVDISSAVQDAQPDEIYNLASQSRPGESWARVGSGGRARRVRQAECGDAVHQPPAAG